MAKDFHLRLYTLNYVTNTSPAMFAPHPSFGMLSLRATIVFRVNRWADGKIGSLD